jgi:hypothetical protein
MIERDSNATEPATAGDGIGDAARDTATPDNDAHILAAIDCDRTAGGTRSETASRTASATLGAPWLLASGTSESISSPISNFGRLSDADIDRVVMAHAPRLLARVELLRAGSAVQLFQQIETVAPAPEAGAVLSAGVKLRTCSWKESPCDQPARDQKRGGYCRAHASEHENNRSKAERQQKRLRREARNFGR